MKLIVLDRIGAWDAVVRLERVGLQLHNLDPGFFLWTWALVEEAI